VMRLRAPFTLILASSLNSSSCKCLLSTKLKEIFEKILTWQHFRNFERNSLSGPIPPSIGDLLNLEELLVKKKV
jgi:hypothetical protein